MGKHIRKQYYVIYYKYVIEAEPIGDGQRQIYVSVTDTVVSDRGKRERETKVELEGECVEYVCVLER